MRVDADVVVPHGADGVDVGAVRSAQAGVRGGEDLQVPVGRVVGLGEDLVGEEGERRAFTAGGRDDDVCVNVLLAAWPAFGDAPCALREGEAGSLGVVAVCVAPEPAGFAGGSCPARRCLPWGFL